jgi:hypothetical protein
MRPFSLGPWEEDARIDYNLTLGVEFNFRSIHRPRSRSFEVDPLAVISTSMTRAFEFVLTGFPVGRATQVGATSINDEQPFRVAYDPNPIVLLEFSIHTETKIGGVANAENGLRFKKRSGEEEPQEHKEIGSQKPQDARGDNPSPSCRGF